MRGSFRRSWAPHQRAAAGAQRCLSTQDNCIGARARGSLKLMTRGLRPPKQAALPVSRRLFEPSICAAPTPLDLDQSPTRTAHRHFNPPNGGAARRHIEENDGIRHSCPLTLQALCVSDQTLEQKVKKPPDYCAGASPSQGKASLTCCSEMLLVRSRGDRGVTRDPQGASQRLPGR